MAEGHTVRVPRAFAAFRGQGMACLYTMRDGLVARLDLFADREAALAAARLTE